MEEIFTRSAQETQEAAFRLGQKLPSRALLCFFGDLGAGKTTFIKGLVAGAAGVPVDTVHSPTFTYLNIYEGVKDVYHFDLYRLTDCDEFLAMGFEEYFIIPGICCIEWSERIASILPQERLDVTISQQGEEQRMIYLEYKGA